MLDKYNFKYIKKCDIVLHLTSGCFAFVGKKKLKNDDISLRVENSNLSD